MPKFLQFSDIHFRDEERFDVETELREGVLRLAPVIRDRFGPIEALLVCGDIANTGSAAEYARARSFLFEVAAYVRAERIFTVPGNHDIYQPATNNAKQRHWRSSVRAAKTTADRNKTLLHLLRDEEAGPGLLEPLAQYVDFAAEFGCRIDPDEPCWDDELKLADRHILRLFGLTSVLVSDQHDEADRLAVGDFQLARVLDQEGFVNLTMCHHPFDWLLDGEEQQQKLDRRSALHITGHIHRPEISTSAKGLHVAAGALQPDRRKEDWEPSLNIIDIRVNKSGSRAVLKLEVWTARWDAHEDCFALPEASEESVTRELAIPEESPPSPRAGELAVLRGRIARLAPGDRVEAARRCGMSPGMIAERPSHDQPGLIVDLASESGNLSTLWVAVNELAGGQKTGPNPFAESE